MTQDTSSQHRPSTQHGPSLQHLPVTIDPPSRSASWTRIAQTLTDSITSGEYEPGGRMPSEHTLAQRFGVNRHTIRRSLASLSSQGLLKVRQGSGTYVDEFAVDVILSKRPRHQQSMRRAGLKGALEVVEARLIDASEVQARALQVVTGATLLAMKVLGVARQQSIHFSERFFPHDRFPRLEAIVRETGSISSAFAAHGVTDYIRKESRITAQMPQPALALRLGQSAMRPVLMVESINMDLQGCPVEMASTWFAADRVSLMVSHED